MRETRPNRTSTPASVGYKRPRKPVISLAEKERQKQSLRSYYIGGGNDIA